MTRIFDAVDVDWGSRDVWDKGTPEELMSYSGVVYLSAAYAAPDENALTFRLYVPADGSDWFIDWCDSLPDNVALAADRLEAAALCLILGEFVHFLAAAQRARRMAAANNRRAL